MRWKDRMKGMSDKGKVLKPIVPVFWVGLENTSLLE
jgi:hypothetical protein